MRVYLAASSSEIERATFWANELRASGHTVVSTWIEIIASVGDANPIGASTEDREKWAWADLEQVESADVFWFLAPEKSAGRGGYCELGFALARGLHTIVSGDTKQSIFNSLADSEHVSDAEAFAEYFVSDPPATKTA